MSDPAILAAQRASVRFPRDIDKWALEAAAREALKPIREQLEEWRPQLDEMSESGSGKAEVVLDFLSALSRFVYSTEELRSR